MSNDRRDHDETASERPIDVFVSSVQRQHVQPYRARARETLERLGVRPWLFEDAPASSERLASGYLRRAGECDVLVLLLADETSQAVVDEVSEALSSGKRLWVFLLPFELDQGARELLDRVSPHTRYRRVSSPDALEDELRRTFSDEIRRAIRSEASPTRRLLLETAEGLSRGRCVVRWRALGVPVDEARALAADMSIGAPDPAWWPTQDRPVTVLVGDLGAGKSLAAERMLQVVLHGLLNVARPPTIPLYVEAREANLGLERTLLERSQGLGDPRQLDTFAIVDGLDEVAPGTAGRILTEARVLGEGWPNARFVLTTRPLPGNPAGGDAVSMRILSESETLALIGRFAGRSVRAGEWIGWPRPVRQAVRRPLFAILLGLYLAGADRGVPRSAGDLLASLIRRALAQMRARVEGAEPTLEELAVRAIDSDTGVAARELAAAGQLRILTETGLVVEQGERFNLALPVLTQWFAAQSLVRRPSMVTELLDRDGIDRWRYPLAIALSISDEPIIDQLMEPLTRRNPALAAQVLADGLTEVEAGQVDAALNCLESGRRIRASTEAWVTGTGPLAQFVAPVRSDGTLLSLAVVCRRRYVHAVWYEALAAACEPVIELPSAKAAASLPWIVRYTADARASAAWPWHWSLVPLRRGLADCLRGRAFTAAIPSLENERLWSVALRVLTGSCFVAGPIDLVQLERRLESSPELAGQAGADESFRLRGRVRALRATGQTDWRLNRPLPDLDPGPFIWSGYSLERLASLIGAIYQEAVDAYTAVVDRWFPLFAPRLRHRQLLPARFRGAVSARDGVPSQGPQVTLLVEPLLLGRASEFEFQVGPRLAQDLRRDHYEIADELYARCRELRPEARDWLYPEIMTSSIDRFLMPDAVNSLVYEWLGRDLAAVSWLA